MRSRPLFAAAFLVAALGCRDDAESPTAPTPSPAVAAAAGQPLLFRQLSTGRFHNCGVALDDRAYCWGNNRQGALGNGTKANSETPVPVSGGLRFKHVSAGRDYTCGITLDSRAYCWGFNFDGELGDGSGYPTNTNRLVPVAVAGGRSYRLIRAGETHTCAITTSDLAFCWGKNDFGKLGDGTSVNRYKPARVMGGLRFAQLSAGQSHTCGVTTGDLAYCWGWGLFGQLGDGKGDTEFKPAAVAGGRKFVAVNAGQVHTCGLTAADRAFCWGGGGMVGDGQLIQRNTPVAVAGGLKFDHLSAAETHTCAVTPANVPYCWGDDAGNEIGAGGRGVVLSPIRMTVFGDLRFRGIWTSFQTCGLTSENVAWCFKPFPGTVSQIGGS